MTDVTNLQVQNRVESLKTSINNLHDTLSSSIENDITSQGSANLNKLKLDYYQSVRNKLFLKYTMIDFEGLLQSLHSNFRISIGNTNGD